MTQKEIYMYAILGLQSMNEKLFNMNDREELIEENFKKIEELCKLMKQEAE